MKKANILGFNIDTYDFENAVNYAKTISGQVVTINPEMMSNTDMTGIINSAELVIPDGTGVEFAMRISGYNVERIAGIEFSHRMIEECAKEGKSVALVGAKPHIAEKVVQNLKNELENLNVVYIHDGYFDNDEQIINELKNAGPRLILCALGTPKQEYFIHKAKKFLPDSLFIGVGGSFDVWSGNVKRAPEIFQKLRLEWLYRTIKEPYRFKRIFPALPIFVCNVLKERFVPKGV